MQAAIWSDFNRIVTQYAAIKSDVLARVENLAQAVGVVAEPGFDAGAGHFDCIFGLAEELHSIVWNGHGVPNTEGGYDLGR